MRTAVQDCRSVRSRASTAALQANSMRANRPNKVWAGPCTAANHWPRICWKVWRNWVGGLTCRAIPGPAEKGGPGAELERLRPGRFVRRFKQDVAVDAHVEAVARGHLDGRLHVHLAACHLRATHSQLLPYRGFGGLTGSGVGKDGLAAVLRDGESRHEHRGENLHAD